MSDERLKDFDACVRALEALGVQINFDSEYVTDADGRRVQKTLPKISNLQLPFSAEEWVSLTQKEGEYYIGGCCGSSSHTQDVVEHVYRFASGWIDLKELNEIANACIEHDGDDSPFVAFTDVFGYEWPKERRDPWLVMAAIHHLAFQHWGLSRSVPFHGISDHIPPIRKALKTIQDIAWAISWEHLFDSSQKQEITAQVKTNRALAVARLAPALDFVREHIDSLQYGPVVGFAVIDTECGVDAIAKNGHGLCIYETEADVQAILDQQEARVRNRFGFRPVRVSKEEGVVFTDNNKKYEFVSGEK
jgi:hypothetical protein